MQTAAYSMRDPESGARVTVHEAKRWESGAYAHLRSVPIAAMGAFRERTGPTSFRLIDGRTVSYREGEALRLDRSTGIPIWRVAGWLTEGGK